MRSGAVIIKLVMIFFLFLAAAGLTAVAGWLTVAADWPPRPAAERGYTMQTLIVTAVLVLVAVGGGVVILAVATSGTEDIEPHTRTDSPCNEVEVFDSVKREAGEAGNAGTADNPKVVGTNLGCIPVCFWIDKDGSGTVGPDELLFIRELPASGTITVKENSVGSDSLAFGNPTERKIAAFATSREIFAAQATGGVRAASTTPVTFEEGISFVVVNVQQSGCVGRP